MTIVDAHVHFNGIHLADKMLEDQDRTGTQQFNILVIGRDRPAPGTFKQAEALWFKLTKPRQVFAFGGLDFTGIMDAGDARHGDAPAVPFVDQVQQMIAIGFDGLKLLNGKPNVRKDTGHPLDGPMYQPMLEFLEQTQFPLTWHVADPPEFWNPDAVPLWAKKHRWWYDQTQPTKAQIDREIANVIQRHPRLNLILPHFFFMSDDLPAAGKFLAAHPNISFDLAPGVEMFHNFTRDPSAARDFFIRHADQIIFGTDIGMFDHGTGPKRGWMIRHYLESTAEFEVPDDPAMTPDDRPPLRGIGLPPNTLEKINGGNFHKKVRATSPRPLDPAALKSFCTATIDEARRRNEPHDAASAMLKQL